MRVFQTMEVEEAMRYAAEGGQALHLHKIITDEKRAPKVFVNAVKRGEFIAHLFDQDKDRLIETCQDLGVRQIIVEHPNTPRQHVDLCGKPLKKARILAAGSLF